MIIGYRCLLLAITGFAFVESSMTDAVPLNCTDVRINNGPLITPCVSEIILQKGQNFTLTCRGTTNIRFRQQEVSEEVTSNFKIVNTNSSILEDEYSFESTLNLYDVDQYAIGYYACSDDSVDANIVNNIVSEPENDEHVSYIYVYVNGTDSLFAPMREFIVSRSNKILIECRPTTPDVEVKLMSKSQNKTPKYSPKIGFILKKCGSFAFECQGRRGDLKDKKRIRISVSKPPEPIITYNSEDFLENETFTLNCTTILNRHTLAELSWQYPDTVNKDNSSITENTNSGNVTEGLLYKNITIHNATKKHEGTYICVSSNSCDSKYSSGVQKLYHAEPFLNIDITTKMGYISRQPAASILFVVDAYPKATILFLKNGKNFSLGTGKYRMSEKPKFKQVKLAIDPVDVTDNANFTLIASNGYLIKNKTFEQIIGAKAAVIDFGKKICIKGMDTNIKCDVSGYPLPDISWMFSYYNNNTDVSMQSTSVNHTSIYNETAYLVKRCEHSGNITCRANNTDGIDTKTYQLLVYDIIDGFGVNTTSEDKTLWVIENDVVTVKCLASIYEFNNVNWIINDEDLSATVDFPNSSEFSYIAELKINQITLQHTGNYRCYGVKTNGTRVYDNIQINVMELQPPVILDADDVDGEVNRYKHEYLNCSAVGVPLPQIKWYKDGELIILKNDSNVIVSSSNLSRTAVNSTLLIIGMEETNVGTYECVAVAKNIIQRKTFKLTLKGEKEHDFKPYVIAIAVIILILIIMIVYLTLKIKKEKRFRKELAAAGLLYFKEGVTQSLNPDLGIDEQAELLPYNEKFEFPSDKLILGVQLGAGAFGVVYKAEARGIVNAEETTIVAVKMVKKTADNMYIKALASELKIMVHLGKHINIVNLLGACTKNVGKRELVVIVEYCKYGNIHNYMQRHREVFIDQLDTDNKEKLGKVNRAYTSSSCGSTGLHSDYFGSTNTQDTDNTFLNTANTVRSVRKNIPNNNQPVEEVKASEGYMQPEWRSNYESDYSYDGRNPRPLTSRDLLAWAFQIARGMEYLASRKVLHGDLAARNILLADDNIVKICDFGLAKSIYKNDEYHKKENSPLPVKWLAIECMTDRIFSTQSDVWSFGIVLWELFTLAKTPYPNIHPASLLQFLSEGHRLDKPSYADDKLYGVMKKCWEMKPTLRPTFSQLQEILGTFLEENVRNHYVDLNITYMDKNVKVEGQEDYLAMMCAPDYNNMVTPSPHRYVNTDKSFFPPTPVKVDDEGYLQMSPSNQGIFSPRVPNTEFDFDPRKFNPKVSEASSCGSELTPMLTLNNLPARSGSESDHEGNPPYLNACPRIDEEADEVFASSLNDTKNAKNIQQSAVTNPTYITFDNIDEKPKDILNNYVNVPNGLVK